MVDEAAKVNLRNEPNLGSGCAIRLAAESSRVCCPKGRWRLEIRRFTYRNVMVFRPSRRRHDIRSALCEARFLT